MVNPILFLFLQEKTSQLEEEDKIYYLKSDTYPWLYPQKFTCQSPYIFNIFNHVKTKTHWPTFIFLFFNFVSFTFYKTSKNIISKILKKVDAHCNVRYASSRHSLQCAGALLCTISVDFLQNWVVSFRYHKVQVFARVYKKIMSAKLTVGEAGI